MRIYTCNSKGEKFYVGDIVSMYGGRKYTIQHIREDGNWSSSVEDVEPNMNNDWIPYNLVLIERPSSIAEGWTL